MENESICRPLSELSTSESGVIVKVRGHGSFRKRIAEMGFVRGKRVTVINNAPLMDPVEYEIMGYHIALRRSEAERIEISTAPDASTASASGTALAQVLQTDEIANRFLHEAGRTIHTLVKYTFSGLDG